MRQNPNFLKSSLLTVGSMVLASARALLCVGVPAASTLPSCTVDYPSVQLAAAVAAPAAQAVALCGGDGGGGGL